MKTHQFIKILSYSVIDCVNRIIELEFIDKKRTIQFTFLSEKKDYWNQWAKKGIRFDDNIHTDNRDIWWGDEMEVSFHSEMLYYDEYLKLGFYKLVSETPIERHISPLNYAKHMSVTKMAVMQRIWRNSLPKNIQAIKDSNGEYILKIN
jgi:hypothetical protein